jgi:hypothetical protein
MRQVHAFDIAKGSDPWDPAEKEAMVLNRATKLLNRPDGLALWAKLGVQPEVDTSDRGRKEQQSQGYLKSFFYHARGS